MKSIWAALLVVLSASVLAACSSTPHCLKKQSYEQASAFPPLKAPPGLSVPQSDSDMRIPPVNGGPVGTYPTAPPGTNPENPRSLCLTTPPPLPSSR